MINKFLFCYTIIFNNFQMKLDQYTIYFKSHNNSESCTIFYSRSRSVFRDINRAGYSRRTQICVIQQCRLMPRILKFYFSIEKLDMSIYAFYCICYQFPLRGNYAHTQIIKTKLNPKLPIQVNARILFNTNLLVLLVQ